MTRLLVIGGTGLLGRPTAERLHDDGFDVRVLARDPERAGERLGDSMEVVPGDVTDLESLERAMSGCDGVHVSVGGAVDQVSAENVARLAPTVGVSRISYLSGATVAEQNRWFPMVAQKLEAEQALVESGVPFTIFRPTWPMEQLPRFVQGGQALVIGDALPPLHWFAAADLARMVSRAYRTDAAANRRFYVYGPEAWTMVEALEIYRSAEHPDIDRVTVLPIAVAREQAQASDNKILAMMADMMSYFDAVGELGDPAEATEVLGPATTTLEQWIAERSTVADAR
jgi:uncharacterized protein YbjT (DUF2867 family)